MTYTLPGEARDKLVTIAHLIGDVVELIIRDQQASSAAVVESQRSKRRATRSPYVPVEEPSDMDRARARRILAGKGFVQAA